MEIINHPNGKIEIIPSPRIVRKKAWKDAVKKAEDVFGTAFDPKHIQHSLLRKRDVPDYDGPLVELTLPDGQVIKRIPRIEAQMRALENLIETGRRLESELESVPLPESVAGIARIESGPDSILVIPKPKFFDEKFHGALKRAGFSWVSGKRYWKGPDTDEARLALGRALKRLEKRQQEEAEKQEAERKALAGQVGQLSGSWDVEGYRIAVTPLGTALEIQAPEDPFLPFREAIFQAGGRHAGGGRWRLEVSNQQDIARLRALVSELLDLGKTIRSNREAAQKLVGSHGSDDFPIRVNVNDTVIRIRTPYDEEAVEMIRKARDRMGAGLWNRALRSWEFPVSKVRQVSQLIGDLEAFSREKPVKEKQAEGKPQSGEGWRKRWLFGPHKDSWRPGEIVIDRNARKIEGVIDRIDAIRYLDIDCMSFGGGPDDRYQFIVTLREPTAQEREQVESRWREMDRQAEIQRLAGEISGYITRHGEYVNNWSWDNLMQAHKNGEILWKQTELEIYGTADWLIRHDGKLIVDQRRHADGDTWSANNVGDADRVWVIDENALPSEIREKITRLQQLQCKSIQKTTRGSFGLRL